MGGENGDEKEQKGKKKELLQGRTLYMCTQSIFSEAAFIGDLSIFRDTISCWASALHQVRPEESENWWLIFNSHEKYELFYCKNNSEMLLDFYSIIVKCTLIDEYLPQLMSQNCRLRISQTLLHTGT